MTQYERWLKQGNRGTRPCVPRKENIEIKEKYEGNMIKRLVICVIAIVLAVGGNRVFAQQEEMPVDSDAVVTNSFWDNWYGQVGVDMNLLFPYGMNIVDVFPNGKSFGVNVAVGKWFSPEFGGRFKITWNNGILSNDYNTWLAPYGKAGENHRRGGFMTFIGDIQLNMHNLLGVYRPDKKWNIIVAPRVGGYLDIGTGKGCPILGGAFVTTYRLNDRWRLFTDLSYNFTASINGVYSETGHGSNGFAEISIGLETDLSKKNTFQKASAKSIQNKHSVVVNSFWDNWFGQVGLGMTLQNPYRTNFANVFPNGSTWGVNLGFGKWFTPEAGVRVGVNWQNGLLINHHATYLQPREDSEGDPSKHSFVSVYADMFFNLHNAIAGYDAQRKWNTIIYPRMGLGINFASENKECPLLGVGVEQTYKINDRFKVFGDFAYQMTTSGFHDKKFYTGDYGLSHNGWFDINVGVQYEFGKNWWEKPSEKHRTSQWEGGHNWPRFIVNTGASMVVAFGAKTALKAMIKEERPDHSDNKSFPSGHASMAFAAARSIDKEFRKDCIWIPIAGYAAATAVGIERIASDRHHWYDVVAGAAVGYGAAELTWWLSDMMFGKGRNVAVGSSGNTVDLTYNF